MSLSKINKKTIARIAAIQAIYQYTLQDFSEDIHNISQKIISFYENESSSSAQIKVELNVRHFNELVKLVISNFEEIDNIISTHLVANRKNLSRMPILLVAVLRVSVCELLFLPDTPIKVVINEFTDIANEMLNEHEIGFVNSILDNIAKENKKCQIISKDIEIRS